MWPLAEVVNVAYGGQYTSRINLHSEYTELQKWLKYCSTEDSGLLRHDVVSGGWGVRNVSNYRGASTFNLLKPTGYVMHQPV